MRSSRLSILATFALVTSTNANHQAAATAVMGGVDPNQFVSSCPVVDGGSGYTIAPSVTFSGGGGSGASSADLHQRGADHSADPDLGGRDRYDGLARPPGATR